MGDQRVSGGVSEQSGSPAAASHHQGPVSAEAIAEQFAAVAGEGAQEAGEAADPVAGELDELVAKAAQRDEYLALAQRTQADFENYRKRMARDAAAAESRGLARLGRELLPALDNLDLALAHAGDGDTDQVLMDGLRLVQRELLGALARVGIESYGAAGERFDPELHEAVAQQPFEGRSPGEIAEVYQPGYRLAGGLVRPARVLVAG
jgi:molecular chaperone GrpE